MMHGGTTTVATAWLVALALLLPGCGKGTEDAAVPSEGGTEAAGPSVPVTEVGTYVHLVIPSIVKAGEEVDLKMRVVTQVGAPDYDFEGGFRVEASAENPFQKMDRASWEPDEDGFYLMEGLVFELPGVQNLRGLVPEDTVSAEANAFVVQTDPDYRIYWGDLSGVSDLGAGNHAPAVYFWYARGVGLLDFAALTDSDYDASIEKALDEEAWMEIEGSVLDDLHRPGDFIPLHGFRWASGEYGDRLVLLPGPPERLWSNAAGFDTPEKLAAALPDGAILAVPHPPGTTTRPAVDPASVAPSREGLVEVVSSLGMFESAGLPRPPDTGDAPGPYAKDLLASGARVGFIGTGDIRSTQPGNPMGIRTGDSIWPVGLTAVLAKELTREAVLDALRERRCYATSGRRYLLEFTVDGHQMGSDLRVPSGHVAAIYGSLGSMTRWMRIEVVGPDGPIAALMPEGEDIDVVEITAETLPVTEPTWCYLRGMDEYGGMAWSSPVYLQPE